MKKALLCTLGVLGMAVSAQAAITTYGTEFIGNGTMDTASPTNFTTYGVGQTAWVSGTSESGTGGSQWFSGNSDWPGVLTVASLPATAGTQIHLQFDYKVGSDGTWQGTYLPAGGRFNFFGGATFAPVITVLATDTTWKHFDTVYTLATADLGKPMQMWINAWPTGDNWKDFYIDNMSIQTVPEPLALASFGSIGLLALARRKRA